VTKCDNFYGKVKGVNCVKWPNNDKRLTGSPSQLASVNIWVENLKVTVSIFNKQLSFNEYRYFPIPCKTRMGITNSRLHHLICHNDALRYRYSAWISGKS